MCTVSWLFQNNGYHLFCNRDEQNMRPIARSPKVIEAGSGRFIAPIDHAGGTWIAANQYGLSLCLLNGPRRQSGTSEIPAKSRGLIVMELAAASSVVEACDRVPGNFLSEFAPFRLVLLDRRRFAAVLSWDGTSRAIASCGDVLLSSSSVDDPGAHRFRMQMFHSLTRGSLNAEVESHLRFHRSHGAGASAYSPCMHRPDAETVSFTHVQVTDSEVLVEYVPGAPCRRPRPIVRRMPAGS